MAPRVKKIRAADALAQLRRGIPVMHVAAQYDIKSEVTFRRRLRDECKRLGISDDFLKAGRKPIPIDLDRVERLAATARNWADVAAQLKPRVSVKTIMSAFNRAGRKAPDLRRKRA